MANRTSARQGGASGSACVFSAGRWWRRAGALATVVISGATLSGCAHWMAENANINGAQQLSVNDAATRRVNLPALIVNASPATSDTTLADFQRLCPEEYAKGEMQPGPDGSKVRATPEPARGRLCLERASQIFNADHAEQAWRRNEIQARLMAASDAECAQFVQHLNSLQGYGNLMTGSLTTIFSGAGAIVTGVNAARAFAGLGAITSGLRAEFNSDLFLQQAAPTIGKAIDQQRASYAAAIASNRAMDIREYPLWTAIGDAFKYNDQCSLVKGLAAMDKALEVAANPGLDNMEDYWLRLNRIRMVSENPQITSRASLGPNPPGVLSSAGPFAASIGTGPQALALVYQTAVDAAYRGEQRLIAAAKGEAPAGIQSTNVCDADDLKSAAEIPGAADCLRRAALERLRTCVGADLSGQFADLSAKEALVRSTSATGSGYAAAAFERDKVLLAAKAQAEWIGVVQGYTVNTFTTALQFARQASSEKKPGTAKAQKDLAVAALNSGREAVSGTACLQPKQPANGNEPSGTPNSKK